MKRFKKMDIDKKQIFFITLMVIGVIMFAFSSGYIISSKTNPCCDKVNDLLNNHLCIKLEKDVENNLENMPNLDDNEVLKNDFKKS